MSKLNKYTRTLLGTEAVHIHDARAIHPSDPHGKAVSDLNTQLFQYELDINIRKSFTPHGEYPPRLGNGIELVEVVDTELAGLDELFAEIKVGLGV